jgi:diaminohydroxyphosphoribosylaminopyrimidine deaminase/5-amino-6-(5-phosphoribosylamino)uracil reductase
VTKAVPETLWRTLLAAAHGGAKPPNLRDVPPAVAPLVRSYLDFLAPSPDGIRVVAHLGVSLDGRIATVTGHAAYVTGPDNLVHMHRLRALADAVLVGAGTVAADDPQLTVRLVPGPSPLRVILDPDRRLPAARSVFTTSPPPTWLVTRSGGEGDGWHGAAEVVTAGDGMPEAVLGALRARGIARLFIEGGGVTVSRFLAAGCLDELQLCTAPVIIGSGRPALSLSPIATMADALRPAAECLEQGADRLWRLRFVRRQLA